MKAVLFLIALCFVLHSRRGEGNVLPDDAPIRTFAELKEFNAVSVSPSGRVIIFVKTQDVRQNTLKGEWCLLEKSGGLTPIIDAGDPDFMLGVYGLVAEAHNAGSWNVAEPLWSNDGNALYFLRLINGRRSIWYKKIGGGSAIRVGPADADVLSYWKRPSDGAIMFQTRKPRLKLEEQQRREAREGALYDGRFMPTFSTQPIVSDTNLNFETQTWRLNDDAYHSIALDSVKQDLVPLSIDSWIQNRVFSVLWKPVSSGDVEQAKLRATDKEGRLRAWTQEADPKSEFISDLTRLRAPSTDRNEIKTCDKPVCNGIIDALWWSDRLNAAVFVTPVGWGLSQKVISVWSPDRGLLLSTPATDNDIGPCSLSDLRLYCVETSATNPGALFAYDLQTGKQSLVVSANPAAVTARYLPAEKIEWRSPTKDEMFGYLVSPRNPASPPPLVVVQYIARGFLRGIGGEVDIQDLASRGIAVFVVNKGPPQEGVYRRKTGYHRDEMDLRGTDLAAYLAGISLLEQRGKIDGSRVGIWGQSHGAGVTELALQSGMPFAAASLAGDSDSHIAFYYMVGPAYQDILRTRDLTPEDLLDKNNPISIINTVHQIRAPILINVADHELLFTADYYATVSDAGLPIEMHVYQNEWHQKWQPAHLMSVYRRNRDWFSFWLQGKRPGDDIVQYQRWDQLKAKLEAKLGPDKPTGSAIWAKALADFEALMTRDRLRRAKLHAHCHR